LKPVTRSRQLLRQLLEAPGPVMFADQQIERIYSNSSNNEHDRRSRNARGQPEDCCIAALKILLDVRNSSVSNV